MSFPAPCPSSSGSELAAAPVRTSALEAREITYLARGGRPLLTGVSVRLEPGEVLAVLGPNGAGKTTLLRLLAGELTPTSGAILLDGAPLARWAAHQRARRIAVLPQQSTLNAALTGLEVVLLGRSPHPSRGDSRWDHLMARETLAAMDAAHLAARLYPSLSGGEKSRVQAARVLAQIWASVDEIDSGQEISPRFLLLDEPTAALDCAHQHQFLTRIRHTAESQGIGVLTILHDLNLAARYADRLLALKDGRTVVCGPTGEVFVADILSEVFGMEWMVLRHPSHDWPMAVAK